MTMAAANPTANTGTKTSSARPEKRSAFRHHTANVVRMSAPTVNSGVVMEAKSAGAVGGGAAAGDVGSAMAGLAR
jgi:hypothetical protein